MDPLTPAFTRRREVFVVGHQICCVSHSANVALQEFRRCWSAVCPMKHLTSAARKAEQRILLQGRLAMLGFASSLLGEVSFALTLT